MPIVILPSHGRSHVLLASGLVDPPIDHDDVDPVVVLEDFNLLQRIAVHKDTVRIIAFLDLTHLVRAHEERRHAVGRRDDGFVRGEAQQILEVR